MSSDLDSPIYIEGGSVGQIFKLYHRAITNIHMSKEKIDPIPFIIYKQSYYYLKNTLTEFQ